MDIVNEALTIIYWKDKLSGYPVIDGDNISGFSEESYVIEKTDLSYFYKLTEANDEAEFTILLSVFGMLTQRYFKECSLICSASAVFKAEFPLFYEIRPMADHTIREFVGEVRTEVENVAQHLDCSTGDLQGENLSHFHFVYGTAVKGHFGNADFSMKVEEVKWESLSLTIRFSNKFVDGGVVRHFLSSYHTWIKNLKENLNEKISTIPIIDKEERIQLLHKFNDNHLSFDSQILLHQLFENQASANPDAISVVYEGTSFTYSFLNNKANQLANFLRADYGINPGDFVGVLLKRDENLIISLLAVLKTGAAYVPLDLSYPLERISFIREDSNCKLVIDLTFLSSFENKNQAYEKENVVLDRRGGDLAYLIYTSGTTGRPKGVMITHLNAVSFIYWAMSEFDAESFDEVYGVTSHCFDLSVFEIFYTLAVGKKLRILNNALEIGDYLNAGGGRVLLNTVPSSMRKLIEVEQDLSGISVLNLAGEPFPLDIAHKLLSVNAEIRNLYGPSEATTYSTCFRLKGSVLSNSVPIGRPIANTQAYVLDDNGELLPVGVAGKLYLSGFGIALGYVNNRPLSLTNFVEHPFIAGEKMYDTGDLVKWLPDGNLEFLGRADSQVKIRGYRIEPAEIENCMKAFSAAVTEAVVVLNKQSAEEALVGYYTTSAMVDLVSLKRFLSDQLPAYMIPRNLVKLNNIPLTVNGKVDHKSLAAMNDIAFSREEYLSPLNEIQQVIIQIWEEVLAVGNIGIGDHFFELGGHSLMIGQIINSIYKKLGYSVSFKAFYDNPTILDLSNMITKEAYLPIEPAPEAESYIVTPAQQRLWIINQLPGGDLAYHIAGALKVHGLVNTSDFVKAVRQVVGRHDILRTFFKEDQDGLINQYVVPDALFEFTIDIQDFSEAELPYAVADDYIGRQVKLKFDLARAPLFRISLLRISDDISLFFLTIHHIVSDGWSLELIMAEVINVYHALQKGEEKGLSRLSFQYKDYAVWMQKQLRGDEYNEAKLYWFNQFQGELPILHLPGDSVRPRVKSYNGDQLMHSFDPDMLLELKLFSKQHKVSLFTVLMSAVNALLSRYSNQQDIIIGTPVAGRIHPDLENQVGLYVNTLAIRTVFDKEDSFSHLLDLVTSTLAEGYSHQMLPFDVVAEQLNLKRNTARSPLFDVLVVLQNQQQLPGFRKDPLNADLTTEIYHVKRKSAQFDIVFTFSENETLDLEINFNTDIYNIYFIENIFLHLGNLLKRVIAQPDVLVKDIDFLNADEKEHLILKFNDTKIANQEKKGLIELYLRQVNLHPDRIAVIYKSNRLSFKEMDLLSNQYLSYLTNQLKIRKNDKVIVMLDHDEHLLAVLIAIKKAQAIYIPLDPETAPERIKFIVGDSASVAVINKDMLLTMNDFQSTATPDYVVQEYDDNTVEFIIYTSGSTGMPKGVVLTAKGVNNRLNWMWSNYPFSDNEVCCAKTSIGFVDHIWELYGPLLQGIPLVCYKKKEILDLSYFIESLRLNKVSRIVLVPSLLREILSNADQLKYKLRHLKLWISSGEELKKNDVEEFYRTMSSPTVRLLNIYGSTEVTADATYYDTHEAFNKFKDFKLFESSLKEEIDKLVSLHDGSAKINSGVLEDLVGRKEFYDVGFNHQLTSDTYINFLKSEFLPNIINVGATAYVGHMTSPIPKIFRELNALVSAINQNQVKIETSLVATMIERQVIATFHKLIYDKDSQFYNDFAQAPDQAIGIITNGGTMSNISAMSYTLNNLLRPKEGFGGITKEGLVKALHVYGYERVVIIGSNFCHYSFAKSLKLMGLGTDSFIGIDIHDQQPDVIKTELIALINQLRKDKVLILALIGNAGTTEIGSIDPLPLLSAVAKEYNIHFHVDAAFGGGFLMDDELRKKLKGIELADSVSVCAHKQLYVPIGLSICLFKSPSFVAMSENNTYYQARKGSYDLGRFTIEGSRNFMSLILHAAFKIFGKEGFAEIVRNNYETAQFFAMLVETDPAFELIFKPDLNIVLYRYLPLHLRDQKTFTEDELLLLNDLNKKIQGLQFKNGHSFVSSTEIKKKGNDNRHFVFRSVFMNPYTAKEELMAMLEEQKSLAAQLEKKEYIEQRTTGNSNISIGKPIQNVSIYILDEFLNAVPIGIVGEICVSGDCVSDGYLKLREEADARFIANPFATGESLFKTGDLGKWTVDGNISYVGRKDNQVKIRGNRVELGEIEDALIKYESIAKALITVKENEIGEKELIAYFISNESITPSLLRNYLNSLLPVYMIPAYFVRLDQFPLNASGKIDKQALSLPEDLTAFTGVTHISPRNGIEVQLLVIWQRILGREKISVKDNFFELGGHSLKVMTLLNQINQYFDCNLSIGQLFEAQTIEDVAELIKVFSNKLVVQDMDEDIFNITL